MTWLLNLVLLFQPYSRYSCSEFVQFGRTEKCSASEIYSGCRGTMQESEPHTGAIVAWSGRHVGFYITRNIVLDSIPEHGVMFHKIPTSDPWYQNPKYLVRK